MSVFIQLRKGLLIGIVTALLLCAWITLIKFRDGDQPFTRLGISYSGTVVTYLLMGAGSGALIGALMRFTNSRTGAYLVGFVAAVPIVLGIMIQQSGMPGRWTADDVTLAPVLCLVATIAIGSEIRRRTAVPR